MAQELRMQVPLQVSSQTDDASPVFSALVTAALTATKFIPETPTLRVSHPPSPGTPLTFIVTSLRSIVRIHRSVHVLVANSRASQLSNTTLHHIMSKHHIIYRIMSTHCFRHHHLMTAGETEVRAGQPPHSQLCSCQCPRGGWRVCYISMEQQFCVCH